MANHHLYIGSTQLNYTQYSVSKERIHEPQNLQNINVQQLLIQHVGIGIPIGYQVMPNQVPPQTMHTMGQLGMQSVWNTEPKQLQNKTIVTEVINTDTDTPNTDNPSTNRTEKNVVKAQIPKKSMRHVQLPTFYTRRQELMQSNKPYYRYAPTILKTWQECDYLKHKDLYHEQDFNKANEELEEISLDVSQLVKERSIVFKPLKIGSLKQSMKPQQRQDRWWIVADTKVLLDDMRFIDKLIKSDPTCRLRLPYEVLHDLTAMTTKRQKAWMRIPARRVVQYLETAMDKDRIIIAQGVIQNEDLMDSPVATDAILNCCLQMAKLYYYVVVISDNDERQKRAASVDLPCFSLSRVKDLVRSSFTDNDSPKPEITVSRTFDAGYNFDMYAAERLQGSVMVLGPC